MGTYAYYYNIIIVPADGWATVEITDLTNKEPLHGNDHILMCTVNVDPGLNIDPIVHWYHPDGSQVDMDGRVREGPQVTTGLETKRNLYFLPVLHDDGGKYTCEAKVHIPWMSTQPLNDMHTMNVTSKTSYNLTQDFDGFYIATSFSYT